MVAGAAAGASDAAALAGANETKTDDHHGAIPAVTADAERQGNNRDVTFATTTPIGNLTTNTVDDDFEINSLTFNGLTGGVTIGGAKMLTCGGDLAKCLIPDKL